MSIESLQEKQEEEYEGKTGAFVCTGKNYIAQYPTDDKDFVREVEIDWATKKPTGNERVVKSKSPALRDTLTLK